MKRAKHIKMTEREFQRIKRSEFVALHRAITSSSISCGCAYLPKEAYHKLIQGLKLIEEARQICIPWWENA